MAAFRFYFDYSTARFLRKLQFLKSPVPGFINREGILYLQEMGKISSQLLHPSEKFWNTGSTRPLWSSYLPAAFSSGLFSDIWPLNTLFYGRGRGMKPRKGQYTGNRR